jgi:hypothetical protein
MSIDRDADIASGFQNVLPVAKNPLRSIPLISLQLEVPFFTVCLF